MNLEQAIDYLDSPRTAKFSPADRATIRCVAEELGVVEFEGQQDHDFFADVDDIVHVHPTMIVTGHQVLGSVWAGTYEKGPFRIKLSRWAEHVASAVASSLTTPKCQKCFNPLGDKHSNGYY